MVHTNSGDQIGEKVLAPRSLTDEVAGHSPADQLPTEKNTRGTSMMFARPHLSSGVQSICNQRRKNV